MTYAFRVFNYIIILLTVCIIIILQTVVILSTINNNYFVDVAIFSKYLITLHKFKVYNYITNNRPRVIIYYISFFYKNQITFFIRGLDDIQYILIP